MSAQWFYLEENGLLWLHGELEKKQVEKNARAQKKNEEEVEITIRAKEKEEGGKAVMEAKGKAVKEEEGKAEKRGWLCIPKVIQRRILHEAHNIPARGHIGSDRTYLRIRDRYLCNQK